MKPSSSQAQDFTKKIKSTLDQPELDRSTIDALNQARQQVLQEKSVWGFQYAKPILTLASVCVIALTIFIINQPMAPISAKDISVQIASENIPDTIDALEMLSNNDALEMYENLEFYLWLEEELKS